MSFEEAWQTGQNVFLVIVAAGTAWATWLNNRKSKKVTGSRVPSDALAHSGAELSGADHEVKRLVAEVTRLFKTVQGLQEQLADTVDDLGVTRAEVARLNKLYLEANEQFYQLRRVVRRYMEAWPDGHSEPVLSAAERLLVGLDGE